MQGSICQEYQLSSVSVPITYLRAGKTTAAWTTEVRLGPPDSHTSGNHAENEDLLRLRDQHLVRKAGCLFPSGREAHEEPALDLCAEAERREGPGWTAVSMKMPVCLSTVGVQLTDRSPVP